MGAMSCKISYCMWICMFYKKKGHTRRALQKDPEYVYKIFLPKKNFLPFLNCFWEEKNNVLFFKHSHNYHILDRKQSMKTYPGQVYIIFVNENHCIDNTIA